MAGSWGWQVEASWQAMAGVGQAVVVGGRQAVSRAGSGREGSRESGSSRELLAVAGRGGGLAGRQRQGRL